MAHLLDANAFITAKNTHYGLDFCPGYWDWIVREHATGKVASVEKVGDELAAVADDLSAWAAALPTSFFVRPDQTALPALAKVRSWVVAQGFSPAAILDFEQSADYYLVSQALAGHHSVVTYELPSGSKKRVKIPDVCIGLGIKCLQPHQMLRIERARFVL
ncbi:MAG: DUF4411 family protein [Sandaracinus sp.]